MVDLEFLHTWSYAKPHRARLTLEAWRDYVILGFRERPDGFLTTCSEKLSYILRHGARREGIPMANRGEADINDLPCHSKFKAYNLDDLELTILANAKRRFGVSQLDGQTVIHCFQGQSEALGLNPLNIRGLRPLETSNAPVLAVHGTFHDKLASIRKEGLRAIKRPIHLAIPGNISGIRNSADVRLYVSAHQAAIDGINFFLSGNGVLLTSGQDNILPLTYIFEDASLSTTLTPAPHSISLAFPKDPIESLADSRSTKADSTSIEVHNALTDSMLRRCLKCHPHGSVGIALPVRCMSDKDQARLRLVRCRFAHIFLFTLISNSANAFRVLTPLNLDIESVDLLFRSAYFLPYQKGLQQL